MSFIINPFTGKLDANGAAVDLSTYVVGPGSATDNALARFDGTTGKLIQDSALIIDDTTGNITGPSGGFKITGGTGTTADLSFQTTSGVGATGADMHFFVGNNGATEAMTILNSGYVGINTTAPDSPLTIKGSSTSTEQASLTNVSATASWTTTGWTGTIPTFTHTSGTSALTINGVITTGRFYKIEISYSGGIFDGDLITTTAGGVSNLGTAFAGTSGTVTNYFQALNTNPVTVQVSAAGYDGTITVTLSEVGTLSSIFGTKTSSGVDGFEIRATNPTIGSFYIGDDVGVNSLDVSTNNVAIGNGAFSKNVAGTSCISIGKGSLASSVNATNCTAVGANALNALTTAFAATALGSGAGYSLTTGTSFTAIGAEAGYLTTTSSSNTYVGRFAGRANVTGDGNTAIGGLSQWNFGTAAAFNTSVGYQALQGTASVSTGSNNNAFGSGTLMRVTSGASNSSFGSASGSLLTSGSNNCFFGYLAGTNVNTGSNNITIGYQAGDNITSGSTNLIIGYNIDAQSATGSNQISIGNLIFGDAVGSGTTVSTGNVGMGVATMSAKLHVVKTTEQLRVGYDASNYYSTTVGSSGGVTFDAVGAGAGFTFNDGVTLLDAKNVAVGTTTGTKIGTATTQKLAFFNSTPIVQPANTVDIDTALVNLGLRATGGNASFATAIVNNLPLRLKGYTVAGLPAGTQGDKAFVTDALAPAYLVAVVGGGAVVTEVFYNGTNWVCT